MKHHFPLHAAFLYQTLVKTDEQFKTQQPVRLEVLKIFQDFSSILLILQTAFALIKQSKAGILLCFRKIL